jgi:GntR family transcriptional repressor for pyruvate dehydrogenase complex
MLGNEPELIGKYGVSRNAFREAVRLLEHLNVARMNTGRSGGLVVVAPRPEPVTDAAAIYLRFTGVDVDELYDAREALEVEILERVVARLDEAGAERLLRIVEDEPLVDLGAVRTPRGGLHDVLADLAGNRPMALFLQTLIDLSGEYSRPGLEGGAAKGADLTTRIDESRRAHLAIAQAVAERDLETAVRRMRRHLKAISKWMR